MPSKGKKYGNASQVTTHIDSYADGGKVAKKKPTKKAKPSMLGTGAAAGAADALQNTRKRQMKELGL